MTNTHKIPGTEEAWDEGALGEDEAHVAHLSEEDAAADYALINESFGLQPISIRLEKQLIDSFKAIATINGMGYQTLMRQALKRFAECEMKRLVQIQADEIRARVELEKSQATSTKQKEVRPKEKKAA
ncbi:MAG TPA: hypothetical protein VJ576_09605 [Rhodocyclaceae bacterium]|nr:hypothetical protein [Rhodocyclaceae bacterium]